MKTAFLFPGQGAQVVGMGADIASAWPVANDFFDRANRVVGYDLKALCFSGPEDKLNSTTVSQPAIFTVSAAILEILRNHPKTASIRPDVTAGLSLGEYTALYAAGLIDFENALRLVQKRGEAMQAAAEASEGGMVSILGMDELQVRQLCADAAQGQLLVPANFNCPGQIVISGATAACKRSVPIAEKMGATKAIELKVAGAFHSEMMRPAAVALDKALAGCPLSDPSGIRVIANICAEDYTTAHGIRQGLIRQLLEPILWQKCMEKLLADGIETFYEIGPGRVLTGLMKRIHRRANVINISNLESLNAVLG
ncbi:MAG: ACP S-malonyltransferase [Phycisphaerae bacterium]|nr:ACP S-malonyltransferase [Phycisphaerae bacterium]